MNLTRQSIVAGKSVSPGPVYQDQAFDVPGQVIEGAVFKIGARLYAPNIVLRGCLFIQNEAVQCVFPSPKAPGCRVEDCKIIGKGEPWPAVFAQNGLTIRRLHGEGVFGDNFIQCEGDANIALTYLDAEVANKGISAEHVVDYPGSVVRITQSTIKCARPLATGNSGIQVRATNTEFLGQSYGVHWYGDDAPQLEGCRTNGSGFWSFSNGEWVSFPSYENSPIQPTMATDINFQSFGEQVAGAFSSP